jgi:glycosyltransferase involved in cell wall biosynthesis
MKRDNIAIVVMTRNEAANITDCLASLAGFSAIYVVDSASTDNTVDLAGAAGAIVVPFVWDRCYPRKKQWCLTHLPDDRPWILFLDADERMTPALAKSIDCTEGKAAYYMRSQMVWAGRALRFGCAYRKIALIRRDAGHFPDLADSDLMGDWDVEGHVQPIIAGGIGILSPPLVHHDQKGLFAWFDRHNRYSDWEAAVRNNIKPTINWRHEGAGRYVLKWLFHYLPARPLWVFIHDYGVRLGFLDGRAGFDMAVARAFYYWQIGVKQRARAATNAAKAAVSPR